MKFFVVATEGASQQEQNAITNLCQTSGYGWWHWLTNFWIIQTTSEVTATYLRDMIKNLLRPNTIFNVIHVEPGNPDWAGWGDPKSSEWLNENWKPN